MFKLFKNNKAKRELAKAKIDLACALQQNIDDSETSIEEFSKMIIDFRKHKYHHHDAFLNLCVFSSLVEIDLTLLLERIPTCTRVQEKNLYARVIAVTIVDYIENINFLIGKECLRELQDNNMNHFVEDFKALNKRFSMFRKANDSYLRDIRNNAMAHKCKDALSLKRAIDRVDPDRIFSHGLEVKAFGDEFVKLSTSVLNFIIDYMTHQKVS